MAVDIFWTGGTASYTNATNWTGGVLPGSGDHAINNNGSNNVVQINSGDAAWSVVDLICGNADNTSGAYVQNGSSVTVGTPGGWLRLGVNNGSFGMYTLNSGNVISDDQLHVGENGNAVLNINGGTITKSGGQFSLSDTGTPGVSGTVNQTNGTVECSSELWVGNNIGIGFYNFSGGIINLHNWLAVGRGSANGQIIMTGGTFNKDGNGNFLVGTGNGSIALFQQSGGAVNSLSQIQIPEGGSSTATYNMSGTAAMTVSDWLAIGRNGGTGTLNLTNGTITKLGNGNITIGSGGGGVGTLNQYGGSIVNTANPLSFTYVGENGGSGTWNMNGGTASLGILQLCQNASSTGTLNLNGGLISASEVNIGAVGGFATFNFNGGTLQATGDNANFFHDLAIAYVQASGAVIDSQGFNITVTQSLFDNGGGGLTKNGTGTLTLTGFNNYTGPTLVNGGTLAMTTDSSASGSYTVASSAQLMVKAQSLNAQLNVSGVTCVSPATALGFNLDGFGNPGLAPLNISGTLTVNGTVSINVADALPQLGQFPLIKYGAKAGSGTFVIGSLPVGVVATIVNNTGNNSIDLNITSVNLPRWDGSAGGNWDVGVTTNWVNIGNGLATFYGQGNSVLFNDSALGTTSVNLITTVNPSAVTINNSILPYTLNGTGKISGNTGLSKQGTATFTIANTGGNNYTGPTVISAGILSVSNLANGGSASAIGSSSANATNLVLAGGALSYTGPSVSINRGYSIQGTNNSIDAEGNLTLSGLTKAASGSSFNKFGPAVLSYAAAGTNVLSGLNSPGYRVEAGTAVLDGSVGGQTNTADSHFGVGGLGGVNAALVLTNSTLNVLSGGMDLGRSGGATGTLTINGGGVLNKQGDPLALGDGGGVSSFGVINQNGGTLECGSELWLGQNTAGVGTYTMSGGTLNLHNWLAIGRRGGNGTFNMTGGTFNKDGNGDFLVGTGDNAVGTLNHSGGTINVQNSYLVPEAGNPCVGTNNISGTAVVNANGWVAIGRGNGIGVLNMSGGTFTKTGNGGNHFIIGAGGPGTINQTGGSIISTLSDTWVGESATATWNLGGGSATLSVVHISQNGGVTGTLNLNGGTLSATEVTTGNTGGTSTLNLNGGTLLATANNTTFLHDLTTANVQAGGAVINSGANTITVAQSLLNGGTGGGLTKLGTGALFLNGANTYTGSTLVSAGTLGGSGTIAGPVTVASSAKLSPGASIGTLTVNNTLTLSAGSTTIMEVSLNGGVTNSDLVTGLTGVTYAGSLVVTNIGTNMLSVGNVFQLFNSASPRSGNFSSITIVPSATGTFNPATGQLTITSVASPVVNPSTISGGNLILTGSGGLPGAGFTWLTSTNVAAPVSTWTTNTTGVYSASGTFSNSFPISVSEPHRFFLLRTP
ncbi:MAG: Autotransporter-associated beta strand repeat protein [Pedosphaera sp.]|nr:Autotransporter-associated beta strand repeat protein [Pedosphaera sp.]